MKSNKRKFIEKYWPLVEWCNTTERQDAIEKELITAIEYDECDEIIRLKKENKRLKQYLNRFNITVTD